MIRTDSNRFFRRIRHDKWGAVSFPLEDKQVVSEHRVIRKCHDATLKKMSSRGAPSDWFEKLPASKTLLQRRQKRRGCGDLLGRAVPAFATLLTSKQ